MAFGLRCAAIARRASSLACFAHPGLTAPREARCANMLLGKFGCHIMVLLRRLCFFYFCCLWAGWRRRGRENFSREKEFKDKILLPFFSAKADTNLLFLSLDLLVWNILWWIWILHLVKVSLLLVILFSFSKKPFSMLLFIWGNKP